jgi:hypothetical protein
VQGAIRSLRLIAFGAALLSARTADAQDASMTVRGQNATPVRSTDVALHGLSADFEFLPEREAFRVKAQFELENRAARETRLQLGLAEARCESDSDEEDPCGDPTAFRFEELESSLRGAPLPARRGRLDPKHEWAPTLGGVWLFDARLTPHERAPIEHRYVLPGGPAAGGGMSASFVTRTGGLWSEPIDKATFTFLLPVYSCLVVEPEHIARRNRRVVIRGGKPWLQLTYAAQRWTPKGDVTLHFETCVPPRDTELSGCSLLDLLAGFAYGPSPDVESAPVSRDELKAQLAKLSVVELRSCGQAVFEAYASYYKPEELAVLAKRPSAQRHYTGPLLTPDDWKWVSLVDEVLAQHKPAPAVTRPAADGGCSVTDPLAKRAPGWAWLLLLAAGWLGRRRAPHARSTQPTTASNASSSRG